MKVMVIVKASKSSEAGDPPSEELMMEMGKFNEELVRAGIMKAGDGLRPSSQGKRVHFHGQDRTVTDGPFPEGHRAIHLKNSFCVKEAVLGNCLELGSM